MNSKKKSEYVIRSLKFKGIFSSVSHINDVLCSEIQLSDQMIGNQIGYISSGHGLKGRQIWLNDDNDVEEMYKTCHGRKEITLWCLVTRKDDTVEPSSKRPHTSLGGRENLPMTKAANKAELISQKMCEVDEIASVLSEKHSDVFTEEQIRAWAHMIQIKKHMSYDDPPDKPFFKSTRSATKSTAAALSSPYKRITLRSQRMDQFSKWKELFDKDVISNNNTKKCNKNFSKTFNNCKLILLCFNIQFSAWYIQNELSII